MKDILKYLAIFFVVLWVYVFVIRTEFVAFYYPYPDDPTIYKQSPVQKSLQDCRWWVKQHAVEQNKTADDYRYTCGYRCAYSDQYELYQCEKFKQ